MHTPSETSPSVAPGTSQSNPRGMFVTGTDTGVGKTVLSACLIAAIAASGASVRAYKPVVTGLDEPSETWPHDHELLASACGMDPNRVAPLRYGAAVSPHLAAQLAGERLERGRIFADAARTAAAARAEGATLVVEGVGGLLVPLTEDLSVRELAGALGLPVLVAARPSLGTINHTLLTLEAARAAGLDVRAVVLTPMSAEPSGLERSNAETIVRLGEVEVATLPTVRDVSLDALAAAGATLPWQRWVA